MGWRVHYHGKSLNEKASQCDCNIARALGREAEFDRAQVARFIASRPNPTTSEFRLEYDLRSGGSIP